MEEQQQVQASPLDALTFLDKILGGVAGSRKDHGAIQGAIGIIAEALQPRPDISPDETLEETPES